MSHGPGQPQPGPGGHPAAAGDLGAPNREERLKILRHSTAHVMAQAVCDLWPGARYAIGPPIEDGFYYDFEVPVVFNPGDLERIDARMREIVAEDQPFVREEVSKDEARRRFADQPYKLELIEQAGADPEAEAEGATGDTVTVYRNDGWQDLCLGPHVESTGRLGAFKLLSFAGAYWRGDERRQMLQRIYGTAWFTEEELADYLHRREEAERRDHRRLGRELDLFSFPDELGAGLAVWHPRGGVLRKQLEDYIRDLHLARGYDIVATPHLARSVLWETSGHLEKYAESMYPPMRDDAFDYYVKPMNCPFHVLIYKSRTRSYRDLPMRLSELGTVYRHERPGVLHGLLRIRGFTQDDSHVICRPDQLIDEILGVFDITLEIHGTFGFKDPKITLSTRPGQAIGEPEMWERATEALRRALDRSGLPYEMAEGEGAFYGPKVDFHFHDAIGRLWQLTTVQVDFALPARFGMEFMGEDNQRHPPVMIHRAILGSIERFVAVLIEHYGGAFPVWLAPEQVRVVPIADRHAARAEEVARTLRDQAVRVEVDDSRQTVSRKVRDAQLMKVPYVLVVGDNEVEHGTVSVRDRSGAEIRDVAIPMFANRVVAEARMRSLETGSLEDLAGGQDAGPDAG